MPKKVSIKKSKKKTVSKTKKTAKSKKKESSFKIPSKKTTKVIGKNAVTLIITEKPQAAEKIAAALSDGTDRKVTNKSKVSYYEFSRDGKNYVVGCAVGHLFGIAQIKKTGPFPNFDVEWRPNYENKRAAYTKKYFDVLNKLSKNANEYIVATDYDVEGEVIGLNIVRFIAGMDDAKRMKFSSLTKPELEKAFTNLSPHLDWNQAVAGETRHYLDWYYGINLSRGLMKALSSTGKFQILSIGRVQGPALSLVVEKELIIQKFKPQPYWQVFLQIQDLNKNKAEVQYIKDLTKKSELLKFNQLKGKKAIATTVIKEEIVNPPLPFDLTTLQTESYRFCSLTPSQTLQTAQSLYLAGLISYPRTSSQEYPEDIGYYKILKQLKKHTSLVKYAVNKKPTKGKKTDPAHPAIYPTGEFKKLSGSEKKLYDLIVQRFISCFAIPAIVESKKLTVKLDGLNFVARGLVIKEKNWINVYPAKLKEEKLDTINGEVDIRELRIEEKMTKHPNRYSPASLVRELEKRNLGTKATRANIIETLYSRNYVKEKSIQATPLGMKLVSTLKKHSPIILDEQLTRELENEELVELKAGKSELEEREKEILDKSKKVITEIAKSMIKHQEKIGRELAEGTVELREEQRKENTLMKCPKCNKGDLVILYNRKSRRYFVACNAYPECKNTYTLPPYGLMKPVQDKEGQPELCQECKFPLVMALQKGKRPWKFCFNPECPSRKRAEENKEKREQEQAEETDKKGKKVAEKVALKNTEASEKEKKKKSRKKL